MGSEVVFKRAQSCVRRRSLADLPILPATDGADGGLVVRAQSGEQGAFNALVSKYRARVLKLSMRYTRNHADAEDAVQNTFLYAYRGLRHFRGDSSFYSWLHRIAVNSAKTVLSLRRRDASVFRSGHWDEEMGETSEVFIELDTPEELALTREMHDAINSAMVGLCGEQRAAIVLRELRGLSYSQIASAMSCPVGTVRSRVFRARVAIDDQLRQVFDDGLGRTKQSS